MRDPPACSHLNTRCLRVNGTSLGSRTKGNKALSLVTRCVDIFEFVAENMGSGDMVWARIDAGGKMLPYKVLERPH